MLNVSKIPGNSVTIKKRSNKNITHKCNNYFPYKGTDQLNIVAIRLHSITLVGFLGESTFLLNSVRTINMPFQSVV